MPYLFLSWLFVLQSTLKLSPLLSWQGYCSYQDRELPLGSKILEVVWNIKNTITCCDVWVLDLQWKEWTLPPPLPLQHSGTKPLGTSKSHQTEVVWIQVGWTVHGHRRYLTCRPAGWHRRSSQNRFQLPLVVQNNICLNVLQSNNWANFGQHKVVIITDIQSRMTLGV